jgi:hypothetical protein
MSSDQQDPVLDRAGTEGAAAIYELPSLPPILRYHDSYSGKLLTIRNPGTSDRWTIMVNGMSHHLNFAPHSEPWRHLIKQAMAWRLTKQTAGTVSANVTGLRNVLSFLKDEPYRRIFVSSMTEYQGYWNFHILPKLRSSEAVALKSVLYFCCEMSLGCFRPEFRKFVSSFYLPPTDKTRCRSIRGLFP